MLYLAEIRVLPGIQGVGKKLVDKLPAILPRRETDPMDDYQTDIGVLRPVVTIGGLHPPDILDPLFCSVEFKCHYEPDLACVPRTIQARMRAYLTRSRVKIVRNYRSSACHDRKSRRTGQ